jgi:uncharacterized protein YdbL (DUF1318 family)
MKNTLTLRYLILLLTLGTTLLAGNAFALDLRTAKAQGYVGEQANGYLGIVKNAAGVEELVSDINSRRKAEYRDIAQRNGTSLEVVEALAGKKAIEKTPSGQYIRDPSGNWIRK